MWEDRDCPNGLASPKALRLEDFGYDLPEELVAQHPTENPDGSRLWSAPDRGRLKT